jgi:hypothetical protein
MTPQHAESLPGVELTELVAGPWQLRPWPAAHADLDDVLAEWYDAPEVPAQRAARLDGWDRGDLLGFGVRESVTGACVAEVLVAVGRGSSAAVRTRLRLDSRGVDVSVGDVVARWASAALGLQVSRDPVEPPLAHG